MNDALDRDDALDRAVARTASDRRRRRARKVRAGLRAHAIVYLVVNLGLLGLWLTLWVSTGRQVAWFAGPLLGWGLGLLAHWLVVRPALRAGRDTPQRA